jgi:hypothetical protein
MVVPGVVKSERDTEAAIEPEVAKVECLYRSGY